MLIVRVVVGVTCHRGGPIMGVEHHFGITVTVPMLVMAMLVVVAVLMHLGVIGPVSALSHYLG